MMMKPTTTRALLCAALISSGLSAQLRIHKVSPKYDSVNAPSSGWLPGFSGAFKEQIFIDGTRLAALRGRPLRGLLVRRDLDHDRAFKGGQVRLQVRLSPSPRPAARLSATFRHNIQGAQVTVFNSVIVIPNSPKPRPNTIPWGAQNSVRIAFSTAYRYTGGTLCVELEGRPIAGKEPVMWNVDHEFGTLRGSVTEYGRSCSHFQPKGSPLISRTRGLELGGALQLLLLGRPSAAPNLLIGVRSHPAGIDLSRIGATNCFLYLDFFNMVSLRYQPPQPLTKLGYANFTLQVPPSPALAGATAFVQAVDFETHMARSSWTNAAGLTTSNGLQLNVSPTLSTLGMSLVRSHRVKPGELMPTTGIPDVARAPVMRILY